MRCGSSSFFYLLPFVEGVCFIQGMIEPLATAIEGLQPLVSFLLLLLLLLLLRF